MKYLLLLLIPNIVYGQFEILEDDVSIEDMTPESVDERTHRQRINYGLNTLLQLPYLLELIESQREIGEYDESAKRSDQARWLLSKNEFNADLYRMLILKQIWMPEYCVKREHGEYTEKSLFCEDLRYYVADRFIMATELQEIVAERTGARTDWEAVIKLAEITENFVVGVDGPDILLQIRDGEFYQEENPDILQRYRHQTWRNVQRRAEERLNEN